MEKEVLVETRNITGPSFEDCGPILLSSFPVHIRSIAWCARWSFYCWSEVPIKFKNVWSILSQGKINKKCKAQMNIQMFTPDKRRGLFCIADPKFEDSRQVTVIWEDYNEVFTKSIIEHVLLLFGKIIFFQKWYTKPTNRIIGHMDMFIKWLKIFTRNI